MEDLESPDDVEATGFTDGVVKQHKVGACDSFLPFFFGVKCTLCHSLPFSPLHCTDLYLSYVGTVRDAPEGLRLVMWARVRLIVATCLGLALGVMGAATYQAPKALSDFVTNTTLPAMAGAGAIVLVAVAMVVFKGFTRRHWVTWILFAVFTAALGAVLGWVARLNTGAWPADSLHAASIVVGAFLLCALAFSVFPAAQGSTSFGPYVLPAMMSVGTAATITIATSLPTTTGVAFALLSIAFSTVMLHVSKHAPAELDVTEPGYAALRSLVEVFTVVGLLARLGKACVKAE